jgi:hypothetical protein
VDLVFLDFNTNKLLTALNAVQGARNYSDADVLKSYTTILTNEVLGMYAQTEWKRGGFE